MQKDTEHSSAAIFMMPALYNETIRLLLEARHFFETDGKVIEAGFHGFRKHQFTTEMSRITLRLSCIMAWLSVQKAVCAGKLSREEASQFYPLEGQQICLNSDISAEHILPGHMNYLLEETRMLYERVYRLENHIEPDISEIRLH